MAIIRMVRKGLCRPLIETDMFCHGGFEITDLLGPVGNCFGL